MGEVTAKYLGVVLISLLLINSIDNIGLESLNILISIIIMYWKGHRMYLESLKYICAHHYHCIITTNKRGHIHFKKKSYYKLFFLGEVIPYLSYYDGKNYICARCRKGAVNKL